MRAAWPLAALLSLGCSSPPPPSLTVRLSCVPETRPLRQLCTVRLTDRATGRAVEGATVMLHADMPSMPLAHSVPPVRATPGGEAGTYRGTLELEMTGRWVIAARIAGPVQDQVTQTIDVERR